MPLQIRKRVIGNLPVCLVTGHTCANRSMQMRRRSLPSPPSMRTSRSWAPITKSANPPGSKSEPQKMLTHSWLISMPLCRPQEAILSQLMHMVTTPTFISVMGKVRTLLVGRTAIMSGKLAVVPEPNTTVLIPLRSQLTEDGSVKRSTISCLPTSSPSGLRMNLWALII